MKVLKILIDIHKTGFTRSNAHVLDVLDRETRWDEYIFSEQ